MKSLFKRAIGSMSIVLICTQAMAGHLIPLNDSKIIKRCQLDVATVERDYHNYEFASSLHNNCHIAAYKLNTDGFGKSYNICMLSCGTKISCGWRPGNLGTTLKCSGSSQGLSLTDKFMILTADDTLGSMGDDDAGLSD